MLSEEVLSEGDVVVRPGLGCRSGDGGLAAGDPVSPRRGRPGELTGT